MRISRIFFLLLCLGFVCFFSRVWSRDIYVAPNGCDSTDGTIEKPLATPARALEAMRQMPADRDRRIVLREGEYFNVHLKLGPQDSGLTIESAPGEKAMLYGGKLIVGWEKAGDKFYAAQLPGVKDGRWDFRMLLVNGRPADRARVPDFGRLKHLSRFDPKLSVTTEEIRFKRDPTQEELTTLKFVPGDIPGDLAVRNAELTIYHQWDASYVGLKAVDLEKQRFIFSSPANWPPGSFRQDDYVIWNVREGMNRPGQWYLDRVAGKVVYWPREDEQIDNLKIIAPTQKHIIEIHGTSEQPVSNIIIRNLHFKATTTPVNCSGWGAMVAPAALEGDGVRGCRLERLTISGVGGHAIRIQNSERCDVRGCRVFQTGGGGVYILGRGGIVENNDIHHVGIIFPSALAVQARGVDHVIRHNTIHDTPYCGIESCTHYALIEYNKIYDYMQELRDGGAIYTSFSDVMPLLHVAEPDYMTFAKIEKSCQGVMVRRNLVYYTGTPPKLTETVIAYYFDIATKNSQIVENLAINTGRPYLSHKTESCTVQNNIFIDERNSSISFNGSTKGMMENNVIYAAGSIKAIWKNGEATSWNNNLLFSEQGDYQDIPPGQIFADPLFLDRLKGDFRFQPNSPALQMGIKPVDCSGAGLTTRSELIEIR